MIRNPYATARSGNDGGNGRSAPSLTVRNPYQNNPTSFKRPRTTSPVTLPEAAPPPAAAPAADSSFHYPDDDGIDWDAAVRLADQAVRDRTAAAAAAPNNQPPLVDAVNKSSSQPRTTTAGAALTTTQAVVAAVAPPPPTATASFLQPSSSSSFQPPPAPSASAAAEAALPPPRDIIDLTGNSVATSSLQAAAARPPPTLPPRPSTSHALLASLRPASWKTGTSTNMQQQRQQPPSHHQQQQQQQKLPPLPSRPSSHPAPSAPSPSATRAAARLPPSLPSPVSGLQATLPMELRFDQAACDKPVQDEHQKALVQHASLSSALHNGWTLYDHQKKAILKGLLKRRVVLALDMGLGKTLIGCVWARAFLRTFGAGSSTKETMDDAASVASSTARRTSDASSRRRDSVESTATDTSMTRSCSPLFKIVVICPVSLKKEWKRTAQDATGLTVDLDDEEKKKKAKAKKKKKKGQAEKDSEQAEEEEDGDVFICSWAKVHSVMAGDTLLDGRQKKRYVLVCDEAHMMQSMAAARTKHVLELVSSRYCVGVLLLTGTPMKNGKPCNLFPLLRAVRHPLGRHQRAYDAHFCAGREQQIPGRGTIWINSGSSNLSQLQKLISSHVLYLHKDDCLKSLPPQSRVMHRVPVSSRQQLKHNHAMQDLVKVYRSSPSSHGSSEDKQKAVLGAIVKVRMVDSFAKIDATVELAKKILQDEPAIVIFTSYVDAAKLIHQKLSESGWSGELLTGETLAAKRQGMVDNFQNGLSPVFCCTFGAGGVGLTLTAACTVILLDRPWTPGDALQAEDRVRRIGQTKPVRSIWVTAFDLDDQIDKMLKAKNQTAAAVLTGGGGGQAIAAPKFDLSAFLRKILPSAGQSSDGKFQTTIPFSSQNV